MQSQKLSRKQAVIANLLWFFASLMMAFFVWYIATAQLDPVEQFRLREPIPIRIQPDTGLVITNRGALTTTAMVVVRAPQSTRELLVAEDILVSADLSGLGSGMHTVELTWEIAPERRVRVVDISPRQITINLEEALSILVPVRVAFEGALPDGFEVIGEPVTDVNQVRVSGPASRVEQVAAVQVEIDLTGARGRIEGEARPVPVDVDGRVVTDVTVDVQIIQVGVRVEEKGE